MSEVNEAPSIMPDSAVPPRSNSVAEFVLVKIPNIVCGSILLAAVAINVANVVGRYVFFRPIFWAEEVLMYMIIWGVFICAGSITYQGLHLKMDLLVINARGRFRMFLGGLTVCIALVCSPFMVVQAFRIVRNYLANGETSIAAQFPLAYTHAAILVGFVLMFVAAVLRFRTYLTGNFGPPAQ
jgi:TRAP-type C4-dicarboxylate transport system permease small subunit